MHNFQAHQSGQVDSVRRDANLDLLRAIAISMVVVFHVIQMSPVFQPGIMQVALFGQYGVDLFFVLSGWLIGRLYWKEHERFGDVKLMRFWSRRWLRTIPPYLVALAFAWLAVFLERGAPFNWGYLVFIQNYYRTPPFFMVSWSLCIEEHFYFFLPLLLVWAAHKKRLVVILFAALILVGPISRSFAAIDDRSLEINYLNTATHFRMEGLLLGFLAAYLPSYSRPIMLALKKATGWLVGFSIGSFLIFVSLPLLWRYRIGLTILALGLISILIASIGRTTHTFASSRFVKWTALTSYSIYLTHALTINVARKAIGLLPNPMWPIYFPVVISLIAVSGLGFYLAIERTSIQVRDRWVSRRHSSEVTVAQEMFSAPKVMGETA